MSYDKWNSIKKSIATDKSNINFNQKEIFMAYFGKNVGFEQNGDQNKEYLRPVLVYKKFSKELFLGIPLTKSDKDGKFYYRFNFRGDITSVALLSQIKLMDSKRIKYRMGQIKDNDFEKLITKFKKLTDVTP